jgi:hypothetical protein
VRPVEMQGYGENAGYNDQRQPVVTTYIHTNSPDLERYVPRSCHVKQSGRLQGNAAVHNIAVGSNAVVSCIELPSCTSAWILSERRGSALRRKQNRCLPNVRAPC